MILNGLLILLNVSHKIHIHNVRPGKKIMTIFHDVTKTKKKKNHITKQVTYN